MPEDPKKDDASGSGDKGGFSPEYIKELREEAASWRTKFRDAEGKTQKLEADLGQLKTGTEIQSELLKRNLNIEPSWIKLGSKETPAEAIDKFLEKYPNFKTSDDVASRFIPKPLPSDKTNTNISDTQVKDIQSIKNDPIARAKYRDLYRSMLGRV